MAKLVVISRQFCVDSLRNRFEHAADSLNHYMLPLFLSRNEELVVNRTGGIC